MLANLKMHFDSEYDTCVTIFSSWIQLLLHNSALLPLCNCFNCYISSGYSASLFIAYGVKIDFESPLQVESIVLSIISMLSSPNDESPANVEAAVSNLISEFFLMMSLLLT